MLHLRFTVCVPAHVLVQFFEAHVLPDITYSLELCIHHEWLEKKANGLHHKWLAAMLAAQDAQFKRFRLFLEFGVCLPLYLQLIERACMLFVRIMTGSDQHPAFQACSAAVVHAGSWTFSVQAWLHRLGVAPDAWQHLCADVNELRLCAGPVGRKARASHKRRLHLFRNRVLRPPLLAMHRAFVEDQSRRDPSPIVPMNVDQASPLKLAGSCCPPSALWAWCSARVCGRIQPLTFRGGQRGFCPSCQSADDSAGHFAKEHCGISSAGVAAELLTIGTSSEPCLAQAITAKAVLWHEHLRPVLMAAS
jgi:hypothetical protein